jgi:hypothetical protein
VLYIAGLFALLAGGAGCWSIDKWRADRTERQAQEC